MRARIARHRRADPGDRSDFRDRPAALLTQPFFFDEADWIPVPASWAPNIVSFKTYNTGDAEGLALWEAVNDRLNRPSFRGMGEAPARFGEPQLIRPRLGQGAFRVLVTDIYNRRCAITHERTLPALEAAHIRPYGEGGEHEARNGLLLRRDIHSLFDAGYVTVTPDLHFEVSRRIKEEFDNGRHYYELPRPSLPCTRRRAPTRALALTTTPMCRRRRHQIRQHSLTIKDRLFRREQRSASSGACRPISPTARHAPERFLHLYRRANIGRGAATPNGSLERLGRR